MGAIAGIRFGCWCRVGLSDGAVLYGRGVGDISGWPGEKGGLKWVGGWVKGGLYPG
jgi:hypothetical protein